MLRKTIWRIVSVSALFILCSASPTQASLKVNFDCYFPVGFVDCSTLQSSFFSSMPMLESVDAAGKPDLKIEMRVFELERRFRYVMRFKGKGDLPEFTLINLRILKSFTTAGALLQLLADLQKCMAPFLLATEPGKTEKGVFSIQLKDPEESDGKNEETSTTGWYFKASGSGNAAVGTSSTVSLEGGSDLNYSDKDWRFKTSAYVGYRRVDITLADGTNESQEVTSFNGRVLIVRTIHKGWSVAAIVAPTYDPKHSNLDFESRSSAGIGWDLVPFLTSNDHSLGLRYVVSAVYQKYASPNVIEREQMLFLEHGIGAYLTWHFEKVDFNANIGIQSMIDDYRYSSAYLGGSVVLRVTDSLGISAHVNGAYRNALINEPSSSLSTDALTQYFTGGNYARWTYGTGFTLTYTFGNSSLNRQDQRWR